MPKGFTYTSEIAKFKYGSQTTWTNRIYANRGGKRMQVSTTSFGTKKAAEQDAESKKARFAQYDREAKHAKTDEYDLKAHARRGGHIVDHEYARSYKGQRKKRGQIRRELHQKHIGYTIQVTNTTKHRRIK